MEPVEPDIPSESYEVEEPDDFKAMLIGASIIFVVAFIPFASLTCCLPHVIGALVAIHVFTSKYSLTLTAGQGIKLGILTCLMGFAAAWVVSMGLYFLTGYQVGGKEGEFIAVTLAERFGGPEAVEKVREQMERQREAGMNIVQIGAALLFGALFATVSGLIGGAIGAAIFKRGPKSV